jgi:hypothetical protein
VPLRRTRLSFRRRFVGNPGKMTWCASTFRRHEASRQCSVDVAVHHFRTPLAAAERSSSLRAHFWMTLAHHQQSTHAGARALAGCQMPSTCRVSISPWVVDLPLIFTKVVNTPIGANRNHGISMLDRRAQTGRDHRGHIARRRPGRTEDEKTRIGTTARRRVRVSLRRVAECATARQRYDFRCHTIFRGARLRD